MLIDVHGYDQKVIQLVSDRQYGEIIEIGGLHIALPKNHLSLRYYFIIFQKKTNFGNDLTLHRSY